jgi:hypothetical protein
MVPMGHQELNMAPQRLWMGLLATGLLITAQGPAASAEQPSVKTRLVMPQFQMVNIQSFGDLREKDPKTLVIRAFGHRPAAFVEGLKREQISVTYSNSGREATVIYEDSGGSLDDSIRSSRYVSKLVLDGEFWRLNQARLQ